MLQTRHGESEWNAKNQFCGWFDAVLSDAGKAEAAAGGKALKEQGFTFDVAHSSVLERANTTCEIMLDELGLTDTVEMKKTWRLNERHYGGLTGLNKAETAEKYGEDQVKIWRRSFDVPPLPMEADHAYYKIIQEDPRYADVPKDELPNCEALKNCIERSLPYVTR
jgi:2,3-bisphosphoglycerate-dependent phosphoglycerate mutase